jgi:hypothetical protein
MVISSKPLIKLGGKIEKIFWTQPIGFGPILYHFDSFMSEIFHPASNTTDTFYVPFLKLRP